MWLLFCHYIFSFPLLWCVGQVVLCDCNISWVSSLIVWRAVKQTGSPTRKDAYIILTPLNPTFIQKKWGLQGYTLFILFLLEYIDCGYLLEPPRRGGSNEYPQSMFRAEIWKNQCFLSENFQFLEVKFSVYLNRHVFVMTKVGSVGHNAITYQVNPVCLKLFCCSSCTHI